MVQISITVTPDEFITEQEIRQKYEVAFERHGYTAIQSLRDKFSAVLERGAKEDVGASGGASENVRWRFAPMADSPAFEVYEGSSTVANRKIKEGMKSGYSVSYEILREWAANKGLRLYYDYKGTSNPRAVLDKLTSKNGVEFQRSRWFGRVGIKPSSTLSPSQITKKALYAIRTALYKEGTQRPGANWFGLYPEGDGKFNYPEYVFTTERSDIDNIVERFGGRILEDYESTFTFTK
jgi:hypothetical protein